MPDLPTFTIGTDETADYRVDDAYASRRHAVIRALGGGKFSIEDGGSTNGLWMRTAPDAVSRVYGPTPLPRHATIRVGRTEIAAEGLIYAFAEKVARDA